MIIKKRRERKEDFRRISFVRSWKMRKLVELV